MRCKKCNIQVDCNTIICPLCHEKLSEREPLPMAFPVKTPKKPIHTHFTVETIYLFVSLLVFVTCITVNYLTSTTILWCYVVGLGLAYGYFLIKHTIFSHYSVGVKIFWQLIVIIGVMFLTQFIININGWMQEFVLPILLIISIIIQATFIIVQAKIYRANFLSAILISVLGFIPISLWGLNIVDTLWPQLTCALVSSVSLIGIISFGLTDIREEISKKFHF